ncbi:lactonase family protein [Flavobacterium sp. NRK F10]|uniref:lactonase family protein n=1 Tax=Flavobacterium sp. NRK F10 TaxID=2954931 RepID=UPI002091B763|nr:lactonase family protein [Flavobacterium sp. NRK F10]MCO6173719.1 lactonase family protein [Flavobacterium sp. NRK F10]
MKQFTIISLFLFMASTAQEHYNLIVGTYTNACFSEGIYVYDFNLQTLEYQLKSHTDKVMNPSYFTLDSEKEHLYSVNENGNESTLSAFRYDPQTGLLNLMNKVDSKGADPCYIINDDKNVISANYTGGTISVFPKKPDGSLADAVQVIEHKGSGPNEKRQEASHLHMVYFSPDHQYVFANDLGSDKIYIYHYHANGGTQTLLLKDEINLKKGSGPRHLVFSPKGNFVYVLQELDGTLSVLEWKKNQLHLIQETTVAPNLFNGINGAADIHMSQDGKFLYVTNRGDANTISVFKVSGNGTLNMIQQISTQGSAPRNFTLSPDDAYVLVANQNTNNIVIYSRNTKNGTLTDTGKRIDLCQPVCLVFDKVE